MELCTDLNEISLARFIDVYNGDYSQLIIDGNPSEAELKEVAGKLISEYISITGGRQLKDEINRGTEIGVLRCTVACLCICQSLMSMGEWDDVTGILSDLGYKLNSGDHNAIENRIKSLLASKRMRLDMLENDNGKEKEQKSDPDHFVREIALVMTHFKMVINENDISAKKYAYMVKQMASDIEAMNRAASKTKMKGK